MLKLVNGEKLMKAIIVVIFIVSLLGCVTDFAKTGTTASTVDTVPMTPLDPVVSVRHSYDAFSLFGEKLEIPVIVGAFAPAINPQPAGDKRKWFTNDHNFIEDKEGNLHWFGIANPFPPAGKELYRYHPYLGHFSIAANSNKNAPIDGWQMHDFAINEIEGTEYVGAPAVVWHEASKRYAMVVETILGDKRRLEVCWSIDLSTWERSYTPILPDKLWLTSRDPQIIARPDGSYWILVVSHGIEAKKRSQIVRFETTDFVHFSDPVEILGIDDNDFATLMESPFLVQRNELWYLFFTYAHKKYAETIVVVSDTPDFFDYHANTVTTLFSHAAEIFTYEGKEFITTCGPEDATFLNRHYMEIAPLKWLKYSE